MNLPAAFLALLAAGAAWAEYSDADVAVLVQQAVVSNARQTGLSADALGRSANRRPDLDVATDVRAVIQSRLRHLKQVTVTCQQGEVVLRGRADTAEDAAHAERLAQAVPGARSVVNRMTVAGESGPTAQYSAPRDEGPAQSEPFAFLTSDGMAGSNIVVRVAQGTVRITGLASSVQARDYVTASARIVRGARLVNNEMDVYTGDRQEDERLQRLIARRLEWSVDLRPVQKGLSVAVKDGVVTLQGRVQSTEQRAEAEQLAATTRGIVVVDNRIEAPSDG